MSLLGMLQQSLEMYTNKIAISETNRTVTYGELNALSNQYYDWLKKKGYLLMILLLLNWSEV
ncbi:hypothetical protein P9222_00055 [Paenibacillus amylolyticus]|nr:hypothetical protein [Paenibacillus amylolyticus]WFR62896.1 hypothetical protein P9222_00055 [Paenibacillus amylolyticus]